VKKRPLCIALLTPAFMMLAGCESLPALTSIAPGSGAEQVAAPTVASRPGRAKEEALDLRQAIDLLQDGRLQQGRAGLVSYLERNPTNRTARSLLRQIDTDPKALLGEEHTLYTVQLGETLGELADRFLGDPISFLALARYNDIQKPRTLLVGQTLKIPVIRGRGAEPAAPAEEPAVEADIYDVEPSFDESVVPAAGAATTETAVESAEAARIAQYHQAAVVHFRNQELDEAIALWDRVLALDPGFEPARGYRMRAQELKQRLEAFETR